MMTTQRKATLKACVYMTAIIAAAPAIAGDRMHLSEACEIAVARSALPVRLRDEASVYTPVDGKYQLTIEGSGPFTCIVERNHPNSVIPQCMDKLGLDSVLPAIIDRSEMILAGADAASVEATSKERLEAGVYKAAAGSGVNYMLSDYNYIFVASADKILKVPPHVMFYAPGLHNHDIGGSFQGMIENVGTPSTFQEGLHGYMLTYAEHRADPNEVAEQCVGQLGERPPSFDPFPKG